MTARALGLFVAVTLGATLTWAQPVVSYRLAGDEIREPLTREPGDPPRGKEVVVNHNIGGCVLCHAVPDSGARFMGNVAPALAGAGSRFSAGQLRLRIVDPTRLNPGVAMPSYYRVAGLNRVAAEYRGKPLLTAQQVEDAVAYLVTLQ